MPAGPVDSQPRAVSESGDRVLDEAGLGVAAPGEAWARVREARSWDLTARQLCDLELLLNGTFAPLAGFMSAAQYEGVMRAMRLPSGALWPIPVYPLRAPLPAQRWPGTDPQWRRHSEHHGPGPEPGSVR